MGKPPAFFKYGMLNKFKIKCFPPNSVYHKFQLISVELYHVSYENNKSKLRNPQSLIIAAPSSNFFLIC